MELVIIAGQHCVGNDAKDCCDSQTADFKRGGARRNNDGGKVKTKTCNQHNSNNDNISGFVEVHFFLYHHTDPGVGNGTIQQDGNTAEDRTGDHVDKGIENIEDEN